MAYTGCSSSALPSLELEAVPSWHFPYRDPDMLIPYQSPADRVARLMLHGVSSQLGPPEERERAVKELAQAIEQKRQNAHEQRQMELDDEKKKAIKEAHQEQHRLFDLLGSLPNLSRADFPSRKPPSEETGGHNYSDEQYERLLWLAERLALPLQSATDAELHSAGYSSWKEYVVKAVLRHWHPRISDLTLLRKISFLPGREPPLPPRQLPRRSMRRTEKVKKKAEYDSSGGAD